MSLRQPSLTQQQRRRRKRPLTTRRRRQHKENNFERLKKSAQLCTRIALTAPVPPSLHPCCTHPRTASTPTPTLTPTTRPTQPQTFLRVVYGDDGFFFRRYHAEAGDDPAATVPPWDLSDGTRVVTFCKTMAGGSHTAVQ